jgi:hypothetical protein
MSSVSDFLSPCGQNMVGYHVLRNLSCFAKTEDMTLLQKQNKINFLKHDNLPCFVHKETTGLKLKI